MSFPSIDNRASSSTVPVHETQATPARRITVVLSDDHRVVRSRLRVLLESDGRFSVLDEAGDLPGTLVKVRQCPPRVLVLELSMGGVSSLDAIPRLRTYRNPELGAKPAARPPEGATRPDGLSPREIEVLRLIALGYTNTGIAEALCLSVRTVESHRSHIQHKVGLTTRADLVGYARRNGLLD